MLSDDAVEDGVCLAKNSLFTLILILKTNLFKEDKLIKNHTFL